MLRELENQPAPPSRARLIPIIVSGDDLIIHEDAFIPSVAYPFTLKGERFYAVMDGIDAPVDPAPFLPSIIGRVG